MNLKKTKIVGFILAIIEFVLSFIMLYLVTRTQMIPFLYIAVIAIFLGIIPIIVVYMQASRKTAVIGWIFSVVMSVIAVMGIYYIHTTDKMLAAVTGADAEVSVVNVYAAADDPVESVNEAVAENYKFGAISSGNTERTELVLDDIKETTGESISPVYYESIYDMAEAFLSGDLQCMIVDAGYIALLDEDEEIELSDDDLKVLLAKEIEEEVEEVVLDDRDKFIVYISGIDTYGPVNTKSRSDVNIFAAVNNHTKQALLISTPRDFYVPLSISNGRKDKLTHAGIYGVNCSMETLGMLYDEDMDYYVRMNFSGFEKIIDSLGGIDIEIDHGFKTYGGEYSFSAGMNHLNGEEALAYARERHAVAGGDRGRGADQMQVIKAVAEKAISPEILKNYEQLMTNVSDSFETSMDKDQMAYLVQSQLSDGSSWNIVTYSVNGTDSMNKCYSTGNQELYVMEPIQISIDGATELIDKVMDGEEISQEEADQLMSQFN